MGSVRQREHLQTVADDKAIAVAVRKMAVQIFWMHAASVSEMVLRVDSKSLRVQRRSKFRIAGAVLPAARRDNESPCSGQRREKFLLT